MPDAAAAAEEAPPPSPIKKRRTETWRCWLPAGAPEPQTITRAALLSDLKRHGVDLSERMLRRWETEGALPHPVRKWSEDHGAVVSLYPDFFPGLVRTFLALRTGADTRQYPIPYWRTYMRYQFEEAANPKLQPIAQSWWAPERTGAPRLKDELVKAILDLLRELRTVQAGGDGPLVTRAALDFFDAHGELVGRHGFRLP